jgi:hypothetical protein
MLYKIVEQFNAEEMSDEVRELLDDGWKLHGSLLLATYYAEDGAVQSERRRTIYAQAMIKEESQDDIKAKLEYQDSLLAMPVERLSPEELKDRQDLIDLIPDSLEKPS